MHSLINKVITLYRYKERRWIFKLKKKEKKKKWSSSERKRLEMKWLEKNSYDPYDWLKVFLPIIFKPLTTK